MASLGWFMIAAGLMSATGFAARAVWIFESGVKDPLAAFLTMAGFGVGLVLAAAGACVVSNARGRWTPPV
jgi:hypothetical protein